MAVRLLLMGLLIGSVGGVGMGCVGCVRLMGVRCVLMDITCLAIYLIIRPMVLATYNAQAATSKTSPHHPSNAKPAKPQDAPNASAKPNAQNVNPLTSS